MLGEGEENKQNQAPEVLRSVLAPSCLDGVIQISEVMTRNLHPPQTQLQWGGLAFMPCCNFGENKHQDNWKLFFCCPSTGYWCVLSGLGTAWVLAGQGEESKDNKVICLETLSINCDLPLHLLANSWCDSSSPAKEQLLICMQHHSGHDCCWHDMSCVKGSSRRDCVSWIKAVSFYPKENAMHQVY